MGMPRLAGKPWSPLGIINPGTGRSSRAGSWGIPVGFQDQVLVSQMPAGILLMNAEALGTSLTHLPMPQPLDMCPAEVRIAPSPLLEPQLDEKGLGGETGPCLWGCSCTDGAFRAGQARLGQPLLQAAMASRARFHELQARGKAEAAPSMP